MSTPTNPFRGPAAAPTNRRWTAPALPRDPGLDDLLADPQLGSTAKTIAAALVKHWAWSKDHCWPSDATVATKVGRSVGHVQRCMRQLEQAGWVRRERTDQVPNGRRLWLLRRWEGGRAGARPGPAPARDPGPAPARDEHVVIVNGGIERIGPTDPPRLRPTDAPAPAPDRVDPPPPPRPAVTGPPAPHAAGVEGVGAPETPAAVAEALRGLREALAAPPRPAAPPPSQRHPRRKAPGVSPAELAALAGATCDPILAAEAARRTAPPPPPEPPPRSLPTPELLSKLPGRHDLIAAAAHRLAVDTGDLKSWGYYQRAAHAVASRSRPAEALVDCWRQATGPKARCRGAVFATAWRRPDRGQGEPP